VPFAIQAGMPINATDPIYALIYLFGAAILPWSGRELARRRANALRDQLYATQATQREAVLILARAAEAKDEATGDHVARVGDMSADLGLGAGLSLAESEDLRFAGMLHDVGKLHVPDAILSKPGPLTADEWRVVQMHTVWGERILGSTEGFEMARRIARSHHENFDGSGYPDKLRATDIPLVARIVRLTDAFDALHNARPYKEPWPIERCLEEFERRSGELFDPDLVRQFLAYIDERRDQLDGKRAVLSVDVTRTSRINSPVFVPLSDSALHR
jgi:putative two-component system response regulator